MEYKITLKPKAAPVIHAASKEPVALRDKLTKKLHHILKWDVIECVHEPTEWVHSLVIVAKKDGLLRLCLDPKRLMPSLNKSITRYKKEMKF